MERQDQLIKFSRQWVRLLSAAATSLIYRLCHVMRDRPPARSRFALHFTTPHGNTHCCWWCTTSAILRRRQSCIVEAHFRDADNNQHRSFQGRETLPLIEDSFVRGFRVKVQAAAAAATRKNSCFLRIVFLLSPSIKLGQSLNTHI